MTGKFSNSAFGNYKFNGPGGGNIKSIQQGTQAMSTSSGYTLNVTISNVDTNKAIPLIGIRTSWVPSGEDRLDGPDQMVRAILTSGTNLRLERYSQGFGLHVDWQVVEFDQVKRLQSGATSMVTTSGSTVDVTISSVNRAKSMIVFSQKADSSNGWASVGEHFVSAVLTSATNLRFTRGGINCVPTYNKPQIQWYVIEQS